MSKAELVAVVGIGVRLPGINTPRLLWQQLTSGSSSVTTIQEARPELAKAISEGHSFGSFLENTDQFDAAFFNILASEAQAMDPQQRKLLEVTYETLQDARIKASSTKGMNIGVFVGISNVDYSYFPINQENPLNAYSLTGVSPSICSNRIAYTFDWHGPALTIDTACSSSLAALHMARKSLIDKEINGALVAGANLILTPHVQQGYAQLDALSPQGQCRAFDAKANGVVRGEGVVAVYLKRLADAIADGDRIYCVISGSGIAQDGQTNGLTAPSPNGQKRAILAALKAAQLEPKQVQYVETHGTGTLLGDPIEAKALAEAYGQNRSIEQALKIGSVKANFGHLEAAAGLVGFVKTALCIEHQQLVASLHFDTPNPYIPFQEYKLAVQTENQKWQNPHLIAGVSSFGFGGTNVHVIVEQYQAPPIKVNKNKAYPLDQFILPLSAQSSSSLSILLNTWYTLLAQTPQSQWPNLIAQLIHTHDDLTYRYAPVFTGLTDLAAQLNPPKLQRKPTRPPVVAFIFSGMGSQSVLMGKALLSIPQFYEAIKRCDQALKSYVHWSVLDYLTKQNKSESDLDEQSSQLAIFSIQIALFETLKALGISPTMVIGSSMGEVAAAYAAGLLSLDAAAKITVTRIKLLMTQINTGAMAVASMSPAEAKILSADIDKLWVAAHNSPNQVIFSGDTNAIKQIITRLKKQKIKVKQLKGGTAPSHTPLLKVIREDFFAALAEIPTATAHTRFYSTVTGKILKDQTVDCNYWWSNITGPIHYLEAINAIEEEGKPIYIELSPHPVLLTNTIEIVQECRDSVDVLACMKKTDEQEETFFSTLSQLYQSGIAINWALLYPSSLNKLAESLPLYPWDYRSYWKGTSTPLAVTNSAPINVENEEYGLRNELLMMPTEQQRFAFIEDYLKTNLAQALTIPEQEIKSELSLKELGIGSLIGMEFYNRLKNDFAVTLPIAFFLRGPSLKEIAGEVITKLKTSPSEHKISAQKLMNETTISFGQERLLFLNKLLPQPNVYHIPIVLELNGTLDIPRLQQAFSELTKRHELLRTVYEEHEGQFKAKVLPEIEYEFLYEIKKYAHEEEKWANLRTEASKAFSFAKKALFRVTVFEEEGGTQQILLLTIHHLIADGWGLKVILNDIIAFYNHSLLSPLAFQFSDYAYWQKQQWETRAWSNQADYWQLHLMNCPIESTFTLDFPRPETQSFNGSRIPFIIPEQEKFELEHFCKHEGITPFMLLISIINILMYRNTGATDLVLGTPIAGRQEPGTEHLVGCLLNMLPLRIQFDEQDSIKTLLNNVQQELLSAFDNQDIPLEKIIEVTQVPRLLKHSPLFQVVVALHAPVPLEQFANLPAQLIDLDLKTAKFDLSFSFIEKEGYLEGVVEYNTDLFESSSVHQWISAFRTVLQAIIKNPQQKINSIPLMTEHGLDVARQDISRELQNKRKQYHSPLMIPQLIHAHVLEQPQNIAIIDKKQTWTYLQIWKTAEQFALKLQQESIQPQQSIALLMPAGAALVTAQLGAWQANVCFITIDPALPESQITDIINTAQIQLLCYEHDAPEIQKPKLSWEEVTQRSASTALDFHSPSSDSLAYLIATSGTSGSPKIIEITHGAIAHLINWHVETYQNNASSQCSQLAGVGFDAALWEIWSALGGGSTLHIPEPSIKHNLHHLQQWIHDQQISHCFLATPLFEACNNMDWSQSNLDYVLTGGDRLRVWPGFHWPCPVINHYGPSECAVVSSAFSLNQEQHKKYPPIGKAIGYDSLLLLDEHQHPVPQGFIGELYIVGPSVGQGYRHNGSLNQRAFLHNPFDQGVMYQTGDLARLNALGDFEFVGRKDKQIKLNGLRIELDEIELTIRSLPYIQHVELVVSEQETKVQLITYVTLKTSVDKPEHVSALIAAHIKEQIGAGKVPAHIHILEAMPLTVNGKIDRKFLIKLAQPQNTTQLDNPHHHPNEALEKIEHDLIQILKKLLNTEELNPLSDFFSYGGNSILAMQFIALIQQHLQVELSIKELFVHSKLSQLAQIIQKRQQQIQVKPLMPDVEGQFIPFPLTDIQQAYWIGRRIDVEGGGVAAQIYVEIDAPDLDLKHFEKALNELVLRHPMLRAVINNEGQQYFLAQVPRYSIAVHDLSTKNTKERLNALNNMRTTQAHHLFNTSQWPLFALNLSCDQKGFNRIHFNIDGLIADALSLKIILHDLWALYQQQKLPDIHLNFRDYQLYVQHQLPPQEQSKQYWLEQNIAMPDAPPLPLLHQQESKSHFSRKTSMLAPKLWSAIKQKAQIERVSPSALLLNAFSLILSRWSGANAFTLMMTVFNRKNLHPDVNKLVGDFTTLLPLIIRSSATHSFLANSHQIQNSILDNLEHSDVGGVWIIRELRKIGKGPFPIVFTSFLGEDFDTKNTPFGEIVYSLTQTPQVWIDHQVSEHGGALYFNWDYNDCLISEQVIGDMFLSYCELLERLATETTLWNRHQIEVCNQQLVEKMQQAVQIPPALTNQHSDLYSLFAYRVQQSGQANALIVPDKIISYKELNELVNKGRSLLQSYGIRHQDKIALCLPRSVEQIVAVLALLAEGASFVPISTAQPPHRIRQILDKAEAQFILQDNEESYPGFIAINWLKALESAIPSTLPAVISRGDDLAYIIFTSGSTGTPKGVQMQHKAVIPTLAAVNDLVHLKSEDTVLYLSDLSFDLAIYDIFGSFMAGACLAIPTDINNNAIDKLCEFAQQAGVTLWNSVPTLFTMYIELMEKQKRYNISSLRCVLQSGDWISIETSKRAKKLIPGLKLFSLGGATEAAIWSIYYPIQEISSQWQSIPYGRALPGQQIIVCNEQMELCPPLVSGTLYISGVGLSMGYIKEPSLNLKKFITHNDQLFYDTGDRGRYLADWTIEFLGRTDQQVKIQGYRIELSEIEYQLKAINLIKEAVVLALGATKGEKKLLAFIEPHQAELNLSDLDLSQQLASKLPDYMIPRQFILCEKWPLNQNGKIDRNYLAEHYSQHIPSPTQKASPESNTIKEKIKQIISTVLKLEHIDEHDDFLALGANSVDLVLISNQLQDSFGFAPGMTEIFRLKNLQLLGEYYEEELKKSDHTIPQKTTILAGAEREQFKLRHQSLRHIIGDHISLKDEANPALNALKSSRSFSKKPLSKTQLTQFLSVLKQTKDNNSDYRALYPSAGSLFPVQTYVAVKEHGVDEIPAGLYYYHPVEQQLIKLDDQAIGAEQVHLATNKAIGTSSQCTLYFLSDLDAIEPLYAEASFEYSLIEAGAMTQLLRMKAPDLNLGLCSIGQLNVDLMKQRAGLGVRHQFMHALEIGVIATDEPEAWEELNF